MSGTAMLPLRNIIVSATYAHKKARLWDRYRVQPLIDTRAMWREKKQAPGYDPSQPILRPLDPHRVDTILYSEKGEVFCRNPATKEQRPMAFQGFESDRGTLKYRCPAAAYGFACRGRADFGKTPIRAQQGAVRLQSAGKGCPRHPKPPEIPHSASASGVAFRVLATNRNVRF